jgi:multidrug resistance efflux pump
MNDLEIDLATQLAEALAEVERLQQRVAELEDQGLEDRRYMETDEAEVERLQHKLKVAEASEQELGALANHREREVERLTAALNEILLWGQPNTENPIKSIARAALAEEEA